MLPAHPHRFAPARRIRDQPHDLTGTTLPAATAFKRPAPQRHREFRPGRVARPGVVVTGGRGVPEADGQRAPVLIAVAPHGRGVATGAVPAARPRAPPTTGRAAEADERQRGRRPAIVELVDRRESTHKPPFAAPFTPALSHTLTTLVASVSYIRSLPRRGCSRYSSGEEEASMELELVEQQSGQIALMEALAAARTYAERSLSDSTRRGYARDLAAFQVWCQARAVTALPAAPQTLAAYLAELALTDRPATIGRKLAAIAVAHRDAGLESPTEHGMVKRTLAGIRRAKGTAQHQKAALLVEDLRKMVAPLGTSLLDRRDRALILLGFAAALRRSELVGLRVEDVQVEEEGLVLTLRRSKTNQEGRLETIAVAYGSELTTCPVRALRAWLAAAGLGEGPLFVGLTPQGGLRAVALGDRMVAHVVKRRCRAVGIDSSEVAGHSLRRGFATAAARAKKPDRMIKRHGRWKSTAMLDRYIEDGTRWDDNATIGLGL